MKKKIIGVFVCMLLVATAVPGITAVGEVKKIADNSLLFTEKSFVNQNDIYSIQPPEVEWSKTYGESEYDILWCIEETDDGGYIACGITEESNIFYGWLLKLDSEGNEDWNITNYEINGTVGGWNQETVGLSNVIQTTDGGYLISGYGEVYFEEYGEVPTGVLWKVNDTGATDWMKRYYDLENFTDPIINGFMEVSNGFLATGIKRYAEGTDIINTNGVLMKIDLMGNMVWQKEYTHGNETEVLFAIYPTDDDGYILTGWRYVGETEYDYRCWMIKTDADGNQEWDNIFGTKYASDWSSTRNCFQTNDGGYLMAGITWSYGHIEDNDGEVYLIKTDSEGNLDWFETFGEEDEYDMCWCCDKTEDGGFIFCITKNMNGVMLPRSDILIIRTDSAGNAQWSQIYGDTDAEGGHYISKTSDNGYIIAGHKGTRPFYQDDTASDGLVVKIAADKSMETPTLDVKKPKSRMIYLFDLIGLPRIIIPTTLVLGDLTLKAEATDVSGIDKVEFFVDGKIIAEATETPYSHLWKEPENLFFTYNLKIRASNNYGGSSKVEQTVRRIL